MLYLLSGFFKLWGDEVDRINMQKAWYIGNASSEEKAAFHDSQKDSPVPNRQIRAVMRCKPRYSSRRANYNTVKPWTIHTCLSLPYPFTHANKSHMTLVTAWLTSTCWWRSWMNGTTEVAAFTRLRRSWVIEGVITYNKMNEVVARTEPQKEEWKPVPSSDIGMKGGTG